MPSKAKRRGAFGSRRVLVKAKKGKDEEDEKEEDEESPEAREGELFEMICFLLEI